MIFELVQQLVVQALAAQVIEREDEIYARNQVLALLQLEEYKEVEVEENILEIPDLLEKIVDYAVGQGIIEDIFDRKDIFSSNIMNCFIARPSSVNAQFYERYLENPKQATEYF